MKLTAIVITKNEEIMLPACLESIKWADEIIVYDNGSTDKTLKIAEKYTKKIYSYVGQDYAQLRNKAFEKATGDWVLYVDADERILQPLREEIISIIQSTDKSAYAISRRNIIFGQEEHYKAFWPDWMIRLLKKDKFKTWVGKIHEHATFEGELGYTKNSLLHLTHRGLENNVLKSLRWSHFDAELRAEVNHPKMTSWRFIRLLITETWNQGVVRKGFFNGTVATMDALLSVFSLLFSYMRLWELQRKETLDETYQNIDQQLLKDDFKY